MDEGRSDGLGDLKRVAARDEIRQLAYRYALAIDSRDLDLLVSLFVPDVRVGRDLVGREALRDSFRESLSSIGVSILFVGNHLIDFLQDCFPGIQHLRVMLGIVAHFYPMSH